MKIILYSLLAAVLAVGLSGCALSMGGTSRVEPKLERVVKAVFENGTFSHCAFYDEQRNHVANIYPGYSITRFEMEADPCEHFHWR